MTSESRLEKMLRELLESLDTRERWGALRWRLPLPRGGGTRAGGPRADLTGSRGICDPGVVAPIVRGLVVGFAR